MADVNNPTTKLMQRSRTSYAGGKRVHEEETKLIYSEDKEDYNVRAEEDRT